MNRESYDRTMLFVAAIWNFAIAIVLFSLSLLTPPPFAMFGAEIPISMVFFHSVVFFIFLFGIGFLMAGKNVKKNISIVVLGVLEKFTMFIINFIYFLKDDVGIPVLLIIIVDLVFGILFLELLVNAKKNTAPG